MEQTGGEITHFVSSMGTTGTIMGVSKYLKSVKPDVEIIGLQPTEGQSIPGYVDGLRLICPKFTIRPSRPYFGHRPSGSRVDDATPCKGGGYIRWGLFRGSIAGALRISEEVEHATIVAIICDRGDRYLSTGVYDVDLA